MTTFAVLGSGLLLAASWAPLATAAGAPASASSTEQVAAVADVSPRPEATDGGPAAAPAPASPAPSVDAGVTIASDADPGYGNFVGLEGRNYGWLNSRVSDRAPNVWGQTGLYRVNSARAGRGGYFDLGGHGRAFYTSQEIFLLGGPLVTDCARFNGKRDCDTYLAAYMQGALTFGVTLFDYVELSVATQATGSENSEARPRALFSTGNVAFSGKLSLPIVVWTRKLSESLGLKNPAALIFPVPLAFGLDMRGYLPSRSNALGSQFDNFYLAPTALATLDFYEKRGWPFRAHVNAGYIFQSPWSIERAIGTRNPIAEDDARFLTGGQGHVAAIGLDYNYLDRLSYGLGIEVPLPFVTPFLEYTGEVPVPAPWKKHPRDDGFVMRTTSNLPFSAPENALINPLAWPSRITPGLRITPGRGLAIDLGVDLAVGGRSTIVDGLATQVPWAVQLGVSYAFSPFVAETQVEIREVVRNTGAQGANTASMVNATVTPRGKVNGKVLDANTKQPIPDARLQFAGVRGPRFLADSFGNYESWALEPGAYDLGAEAPDYDPGNARAEVKDDKGATVDILLKPNPRLAIFKVNIVNEKDESVKATVTLTDAKGQAVTLNADDGSAQASVPPGKYSAVAKADGYLLGGKNVVVEPGRTTAETFLLKPEPKKRSTVLTRERIEIKSTIFFEYNKARLLSPSFFILDEVVDTVLKNPQIGKLRVEGHTDNTGNPDYNMRLSQSRAEAVRDYLVQNGVSPDRLEAGGFGDTRPIASNASEAGKARNRRVEFVIVNQEGGEGQSPSH